MPYTYGDRQAALMMKAAKRDELLAPILRAGRNSAYGPIHSSNELREGDTFEVLGDLDTNTGRIRVKPGPRASSTMAHEVGHMILEQAIRQGRINPVSPKLHEEVARLYQYGLLHSAPSSPPNKRRKRLTELARSVLAPKDRKRYDKLALQAEAKEAELND